MNKLRKSRGRPPRNIIVPHPLKGDEWLQVGAYDKHWPAVNRYWILVREGASRSDALKRVLEEFDVSEQGIVDWLARIRKRGPIGAIEDDADN